MRERQRRSRIVRPPPDRRSDLHQRVLEGDGAALAEVYERIVPSIGRQLRRAFRLAADDVPDDAIQEAIIDYARHPGSFDPMRGMSLERFLYRAAWRNLADSIDGAAKREARERAYASWAELQDEISDSASLDADAVRRILSVASDSAEREALGRWLRGGFRTEVLAVALGIDYLPTSEQQRHVKRFKDRIGKRLVRLRTVDPITPKKK